MSGYSYRWQAVTSIPIQSTFQYGTVSLLPQDGPNSVDSWLKFRRSTGLTEGQCKFIVQARIKKERQNGQLVTEVTHKLMALTPNGKFGGPDDSGSFVFDQYGCQSSGQAKRVIPHGGPHQSARHRIIIMQIIRNSTDNLFRNVAPFLTPGSSLCNNKNR